jgi:TIR domain
MSQIFLSYSNKDREFVNRLVVDLRSRGLSLFHDQSGLEVGDSLFIRIQHVLSQVSWLVIVLSPDSVASKWVCEELSAIHVRQLSGAGVDILPVLHRDCEIPLFLQSRVFADFRTSYSDGMQRLLRAIRRRYLGSPSDVAEQQQLAAEFHEQVSLGQGYGGDLWIHWERESKELNVDHPELLNGLWLGPSGKLDLEVGDKLVHGRYDWQGHQLSGSMSGEIRSVHSANKYTGPIRGGCIAFSWEWSINNARGQGLFYNVVRDVLIGGWWMEYDLIDANELARTNGMPPNLWTFRRMPA